ncbi:MAG: AAA family ATPase [Saprospiraceae bacterium]|nr:AAA family ATPase [Saprospiraceae bacterium]
MGKEPVRINTEFNAILDLIENQGEHLFITGRAGTGKSTLLNLVKRTTRKNAVVLAPTGIAALHVGGQTIHSFFKLPPKMIDPGEITKRKNHRFYKKVQLLIIDEISMVRADLMDCIDMFLRVNKEINRPFGGVQLVVFGDLFQLPPVVSSTFERQLIKEKYGNPYFFSAQVFKEIDLRMIELRTVYRQTERRFINLLDSIRLQQLDYDILEEINSRYSEKIPEDIAITLCSTNATVNAINNEKLKALVSPLFEYTAKLSGEFNQRLSPADAHLWLKEGAQVMFVKNDPEGQFVNGTLGQITSLAQDEIIVSILKDGEVKYINVDRVDWEMLRYEIDPENKDKFKTRVTGTFTQYPLKLAWAITIHKSQGKTFDNIIIDLGKGAFDYGQTYVAMSRCRTMEGITLKKKITPRDIMVDQAVIEYYDYKIRNW